MTTAELSEQVVRGAIQHMNEDHANNLLDYAKVLAGCEWAVSAEMTHLDTSGFSILVKDATNRAEDQRIDFDEPVADGKELRAALVALAQKADLPDGIKRVATAQVPTPNASRYVKALCNHFNRKAEGNYEGDSGKVAFAFGNADLSADDGVISLRVEAESERMFDRVKDVVGGHLVRFAKKEELTVKWTNE